MASERAPAPDVEMADAAAASAEASDDAAKASDDAATADGDDAPAEEEKEEEAPAIPPEELVPQAESAKEDGNLLLKSGNFAAATAKYGEGIDLIEVLLDKDSKVEMADDLRLRCSAVYAALRLNSAQACIKQSDWVAASEHADKVLLRDADNCKALYRRALACCNLESEGRLEQAVADSTRWAKLEPTSREAREQLRVAKEKLREVKQNQKAIYQRGMSGGGMYKEQHAKLDRHRLAYEEEAKRRTEAEEDEISFEDWQKKQKEDEDKAKKKAKEEAEKAAEQRSLDEENARRRGEGLEELSMEAWKALKKKGTVPKTLNEVCQQSVDDLDEDEKKMLAEQKSKGYYHGRLGTVLSDEAPKPKKVDRSPSPSDGDDMSPPEKGGRGSDWNVAGTWEERDMSTWAKERLTSYLKTAASSSSSVTLSTGQVARVSARVKSVKSLTGDASIVMVRREPRFGYNFEAELSFRVSITLPATVDIITNGEASPEAPEKKEDPEVFEGTFSMPELVDSMPIQELRIDARWKAADPREQVRATVLEWVNNLRDNVRAQVALFKEDYKKK